MISKFSDWFLQYAGTSFAIWIASSLLLSPLAAQDTANSTAAIEPAPTTWTNDKGVVIEAEFVSMTDEGVVLRLSRDGREAAVADVESIDVVEFTHGDTGDFGGLRKRLNVVARDDNGAATRFCEEGSRRTGVSPREVGADEKDEARLAIGVGPHHGDRAATSTCRNCLRDAR